ncbi:serine-rich adhesin for platelets isoform X2 [Anabrus simplex]|uniref:serine-rich adhesin for platelets isoform X2 n=1 Tax=Anabrus simplex TaxID=316456 RepID=UPI0035A2BB17
MAPTPPLPVTEDTPPDMLAGSMDLHVVLPTGRSVKMSVERGTPMMDLLVQVATANKIPPGGHVIQAVGERGLLPYKPSTPIGALDTWTIQIVPKSRPSSTAGSKTASSKASNQQPFEQTFRLQVHLPRNQLFVARVSPKTVLSDVLNLACTEKNLDPSKYELRHPANLEERLRPDWTLADYKLQEVTMVAKRGRPLGAGLSSSDIMALQKEEEKRRQQTRAGGSTGSAVLGLMFNKRSQSSVCDGSVSSDSLGGRSISPINSDDTPSPPGSSLPPPRPARKRRPAPKPPGPPAAVISHSRNSSDSSGYHEASVLSESPESNGLSSPSGTLPRRSKLTSATPAPPQNTSLSRSLSNLTTVSNGGNKPAPRPEGMKSCTHSVSTSSLASSGHGKKKKAAPPPPPVAANSSKMTPREPVQPQRTLSLSTLSSQSSIDNCDSAADGMLERNRLSSSVSVSRQEIQPVPEEVSKIPPIEDKRSSEMSRESSIEMYSETSSILSSPERQTNPLDIKTKSTAVQEKNAKNQAKQQSPELESITLKKTEVSNAANIESFPVSPIVEIKNKNNKLKCEERPLEPQSKLLVEKPPASSKVEPLPDVVSGSSPVPTPKPRIVTSSNPETLAPVPRPRRSPLVLPSADGDSSRRASRQSVSSSEFSSEYGSVGRTFGVGKTMIMLAASSQESSSSNEHLANSGLESDVASNSHMLSTCETDEEFLNMAEKDLKMFETRRNSSENDSLIDCTPQDATYDSLSVTSSLFDSEHETSCDGTWGRNSVRSHDLRRGQFVMRHPSKKLRSGSLRSMKELPGFLKEDKILSRWPPAEDLFSETQDLHAETQETGLQLDSEEIDRAFQSVTDELEAAILADELKQASPLPDLPSPVTGSRSPSLSDWEYQLPAPPTAFQDRQSPTPTLGETIELGETGVFQENLPSEPFPPRFSNPKSQASEQISRESVPQSTPSSAQCLPSQDIDERLHKSKTTINPLYNAELFEREAIQNEELNERLSGNTAGHKTSLHNGVGKNDEEEDDWKPQQLRAVSEVDIELKNSSNNVIRRSSFNDVGQSNQLKNFTITTYQRPRDTDNIFSEDNGSRRIILSEFKKPLEATLSKQQNGSAHPLASSTSLPRTNSFNTSNMETVEHSVVRRSTSHVSLVNSARNLRAKSIGNISAVTSREGRKNSESEATVDSGHERLRKTSSEMAINRGSDDINKVEQSAGHPASPDEPLQSLQVMRNILNPNDQEPRKDTNSNEQVARRVSSEMHSAQKQEDTQVSQPVVKPAVTIESQSESTTNGDVTKRYRYTPPSVNFSTWSERPKSQVSIKLDSDYRIGTGQGGSQESQSVTEVKTEQRERLSDTTSGGEPKNTSGVKLLQGEVSNPAINQTTKVEPVPLSMRIVSHTTSSSYSKRTPSFSNQRIDFVSKTNDQNSKETHQVVVRTSSYNTAQIADPSRIPIVRAVELKKSFLQGQQQQQQPQQQQNKSTSVQLSWNGTDDLAKRNGTTDVKRNSENEEPEIFQGVNNLAKMFSAAAPNSECVRVGFRGNSTRPVSAYLYNGSNDATESSDMKRNSTSTSALNTVGIGDLYVGNTSSQLNTNGPKKYTSVVGINGAAISTSSFREPDVNRNHPKVTNSASIKVNGFAVPKQPMPVVKGFRYPSNGTNHSDSSLLAANSHKSSTVSEPLTVKVQRSDSYTNQNQRNSSSEPAPTFNVRIQHTPTVKIDSLQAKTRQTTIPVPPPAPAPLKKTVSVRPKSFAASEPSPRDQLMDAIRNFGGRNNLKQTGGS